MSNEDIFGLQAWIDDDLFMVMPKEDWMDTEGTIPASSLTFDRFNEEDNLSEIELADFNSFIATVRTPCIAQSLSGILFSALGDLNKSKAILIDEGMYTFSLGPQLRST